MEAALDGDVSRLDLGHLADHLADIGEDAGAGTEQILGLVGQEVGLLLLEVTDGNELHSALR
jgi:hypothetical protein